ncbi:MULTISPECIES: TfuA-like protein [unclassified Ruegeria]|uniref:TfuA-like protein n=1 Tax=unclassified Ruegeria TaxID=2625375 RepID=UPI001C2C8C36|nr:MULTISPECIES: TfuA-like protein [unclassified Ruegeria]
MTVIIFCGPTIGPDDAQAYLHADYRPPAAQGDVMAAVASQPRAIGIIDGYFQLTPSVLHKEILWALHHGIHVFGSSSMGALRAAELHGFGMIGIGRIFEGYRDGQLIRDDEVALNHGPAELGYPALSQPLVNIRATLGAAVQQNIVLQATADKLLDLMDQSYFSNRSYRQMIDLGHDAGLEAEGLSALEAWMEHGAVDLKKKDAIEMLTHMRSFLASDPERFVPKFHLERTSIFDQTHQ